MPIQNATRLSPPDLKVPDHGGNPGLQREEAKKPPSVQLRQPGELAELETLTKAPAAANIFTGEKYPIADIRRELAELTNPALTPDERTKLAVRLSVHLNCKPELSRLALQPSRLDLIEHWHPPAGFFPRFGPRPPAGMPSPLDTRATRDTSEMMDTSGAERQDHTAPPPADMRSHASPVGDSPAPDAQTARVLDLSTAELLDALARIGPRQSPQLTQRILKLLIHSLAKKPEFSEVFKDQDTIGASLARMAKNGGDKTRESPETLPKAADFTRPTAGKGDAPQMSHSQVPVVAG